VNKDSLRNLPSVDELLNRPEMTPLAEEYGRGLLVRATRRVLDELRSEIIRDEAAVVAEDISPEKIVGAIAAHLERKSTPSLRKAVNAAGVILHTGLGRAVLSQKAIDAINDVIRGYCTLATDIETGRRGHRDVHLNDLLCELTGAEAATVVNNNAAATMLILNTLARGKEVIVSRGQLVEIGGSFRMPEVMETSGAILREVGTTNKTHLRDYVAAVNENTGAILRVHQSNYRIVGFFEEPPIEQLVELGKAHGLPVIDDLGSGALIDLKRFGLETEPLVQDSIKAGVDVACFSGDKLIGGPQAGVIVGKTDAINRIKKSPLARAFRIGKMTIAGMEATLRLFLNPEKLCQQHPTYRMLSLNPEELAKRAERIASNLRGIGGAHADLRVVDGVSEVGSGSVPTQTVPTKLLSLRSNSMSAAELARRLRCNNPPIFARVQKETVLLDFRTIQPDEDGLIEDALRTLLKEVEKRT
jgi:L-seryl-tRNA(Ser) seleniumtransferase